MAILRFQSTSAGTILAVYFLVFTPTATSWTTCEKSKTYIVLASKDQQLEGTKTAAVSCYMLNPSPPIDGVYCNRTFHGSICWPNTPANSTVAVPCPDYVHGFDTRGKVKRHCTSDGTWHINSSTNKSVINYTGCMQYHKDDAQRVPVSAYVRSHAYTIQILYEIGYSISLASLTLAVLLMLVFRKLHCHRNTIHLNLFVSFILRAILCLVKDTQILPKGSAAIEDEEIHFVSVGQTWPCKLVFALLHYVMTANYMWILVEGLYLHTLIFFAMSNLKKLFKFHIVFGWVAPVPSVLAWVIVRIHHADSLCWSTNEEGYLWIVRGPIVLSISINFLLFLNIIRVLFTKLTATNRADPNRYRKLARSTLVLIPLFGVYYICFAAIPDCIDDYAYVVLMYIEIFCGSFQGLVVAVLFCFMNSEVKSEIAKVWKTHMLRRQSTISFRSNRTISTGGSMCFPRGSPTSTHQNETIRENMDSSIATPHSTTTFLPISSEIKNGDIYTVDVNNDVTITVNGAAPNNGALSTSDEDITETSRML